VKELILTHISRRYTDLKELEEAAKKEFENSKIAYDFMKVKVKS
jgi:ribonuclease BN (tRNA processing enzyme)